MVWVYTVADEWEHTTPVLSLCHGSFTGRSIFRIPFLNVKVTQWRQISFL